MMPTTAFEAVRREISYAYSRVAFFRAHMDLHGLAPCDIVTPADMSRLPPTRKPDYRSNFPAGVLAQGHSLADAHVMRFQSSGTSGERLNSAVLSYDLARRQATSLEVNRRFDSLWRPGLKLRSCRYAPPNCSDVECASGLSTMADRTLPDGTLVLPVAHDLLTTPPRMIAQALDEVAAHDPHLLVVDPTHAAFLVRRMRAAGREIRTSHGLHIISGYTMLTRVARRQIHDFFGADVPVADMLGMSELGYLGFECDAGSQHLNDCDFYVEIIGNAGPVPPGVVGELVITTIDDVLSPRIRYATGDLYRFLDRPCACGSHLPVVRFEGRATNVVRCADGSMLTPREVDDVVGEAPWIDIYRLEQDATARCRFRYAANQSVSAATETDLAERVRAALRSQSIDMVPTNYIPCDRSGKFQSCASALSGGYVN